MRKFETAASDKQCVFQCGNAWFALPASAVREVAARPSMAPVPKSDTVLAGLCNERNEFLPVMRLPARWTKGAPAHQERQILVLSGPNGPWALLVDRVQAVESIEYAMDVEGYCDEWSSAVMGTTTRDNQIVRVLDSNGLYRLAETILKRSWSEGSIRSFAKEGSGEV